MLVLAHSRLRWLLIGLAALIALFGASLRLFSPAEPAPPQPTEVAVTPTAAITDPIIGPITETLALTVTLDPLADDIVVQAVPTDPDTLNPLLTTNPTAQEIAAKLLPSLLGQDPFSGALAPTALAERWQYSPDGRVYTFTLRTDVFWNDGHPVTAQDVQYTYAALADPAVDSPLRATLQPLEQLLALDERTVVVTLRAPHCAALHLLRYRLLPSHHYAVDFSDLRTHPLNMAPTISAGPFQFAEWQPGERIRLTRNPTYWQGAPQIAEWQYRILPDPARQTAALLAGEVDLAQVNTVQLATLAEDPRWAHFSYPDPSYSLITFNLADPQNPQPGRTENGELNPQAPHPILGDLRVRQAFALAVDANQLLDAAYGANFYRLASYLLPSQTWAYASDLALTMQRQGEAAALLSEAGWVDSNGDGLRDRADTSLRLTLITNEDSPARLRIGELLQTQLRQVGVDLQVVALPFDELANTLLGQRFDLAVIGWENIGPDPATSAFWHSRADQPGSGLNLASLQDEQIDQWLDEADRWPGCDPAGRAERYRNVQARLAAQLPAIFLGGPLQTWLYPRHWQGVQPGPWQLDHNLSEWITQP